MSYYLNIYACPHAHVSEFLNSGVDSRQVVALINSLSPEEQAGLRKLVLKNYSRDPETAEGDDANELTAALEAVCEHLADNKTVVEFELDEDLLPELWEFAFDDWDVADDFELPISADGTPAVIYRNNESLEEYLAKFKEMESSGDYDEDCLEEEDLETLIQVIEQAVESDSGLFVFCWQ